MSPARYHYSVDGRETRFVLPGVILQRIERNPNGHIVALGELVVDDITHADATTQASPGGSGVNFACGVAAFGQGKVPIRLVGLGPSSEDEIATLLAAEVAARGVDVRWHRKGRSRHGTITIDSKGERAISTPIESPQRIEPGWIPQDAFDGASVVYVDGRALKSTRSPAAVAKAAEYAHLAGAVLIADSDGAHNISSSPGRAAELLGQFKNLGLHVLSCSGQEAEALGIVAMHASGDLDWLPMLIVHNGAAPTQVFTGNGEWAVPVNPVPAGEIENTLGCGDAIAAAVSVGLARGSRDIGMIVRAHDFAARVLRSRSAQVSSTGRSRKL